MKLFILTGPIASGKSSYAKNAAKSGILCVNDDDIVNMLHCQDYTLYQENLKILYKSIENHVITSALIMNKTVLIDRGLNGSIHGRKRFLALAKSFDIPCEAIVFENQGPEVHAARRTQSDSRGHLYEYWLKVANRHASLYQEPTIEEGFDAVHHITFKEIQEGRVFL